ncbi:MAG: hypothetical protein A2504_04155 [Bdellovibrionales bacterium RIFOXYD12_FULL_39_22]|nr:MAG: hypothetical protein A2385_07670 [Bdellovibrionales bacterium RIFOXYB1_FULL_39_21]OFZ42135.1 MAG: hypothetical protein A2485_09635 [Bdellovibrionales bacterium RIFOXYC12_FULL_39_17]OFZ50851.1 MAG: hypothetical protein A2404_06585 [Bdellovibrionales bacterium RIFOXYC1_FULL_39_130]OFZ73317.1 MAG: hypothetical protein A2451_10325 [Bdellovibrionales bacterium RIFOXYC2_FULL_39_8]OFZ78074.1 MAG: hypothetical protein A2560_01755 [Bdellovibrionales bacterium RIFOXYD1_FULL_39_84]OFZ93489.1 MAG:
MTVMGRPTSPTQQQFAQLQMHKPSDEKNKQKIIENITGKDAGVKFVDAKEHNKMGKDEFLKLLTHQLSQQDPLNPMDQKQFAADLAQFTQLEQLTNMRAALEKQNENRPAENKFYAAGFLGKKVLTAGTTIDYKGERSVDIPFNLSKDAKALVMKIYDEKNQMIAQIEKEGLSKGSQQISWDGHALDTGKVGNGKYRVEVTAWDEQLEEFKGETKSYGVVTGVAFDGGETVLKLDGQKSVFLRDVERIELVDNNMNMNKNQLPTGEGKITKQANEAYTGTQNWQ